MHNKENLSILSFHVPKTLSSNDINKNLSDNKKIGISIDYIKIKKIHPETSTAQNIVLFEIVLGINMQD